MCFFLRGVCVFEKKKKRCVFLRKKRCVFLKKKSFFFSEVCVFFEKK